MKLWLCAREIPYPIAVTPGCFTVAVEWAILAKDRPSTLPGFLPLAYAQ